MTDDYLARKTRMFVRIVPELGAIPPDQPNSSLRWLHDVSVSLPQGGIPQHMKDTRHGDDSQHEAPGLH